MDNLNEKLAKWAGLCFHEWEVVADTAAFPYSRCRKCLHCGESYSTDISKWDLPKCADGEVYFDESLDACVKWLIPELYKRGYYYELLQWNNGQHKAIITKRMEKWAELVSEAVAETLSLAICLAVEKVVDNDFVGEL